MFPALSLVRAHLARPPISRCQKSDTPPAVGPGGNSITSGPVWFRSMKLRM